MPRVLRPGAPLGQRHAARVPGGGLVIPQTFVAASRVTRALLRSAKRYARVDATVLITGETGVGKDALARVIHAASPRRRDPFVTVDCAGLPGSLVESELFGHERGAFTDATTARVGRFEAAGRGTLYLDAITSLSPAAQAAILRAVEERQVVRLGGTAEIPVQARLLASAPEDVAALVKAGGFRTDLYHRLSVLPLHIPPLRERVEEIPILATRFVGELSQSLHRTAPRLSNSAKDALMRYRWPGNVRELRHVIERTLVNSTGPDIRMSDLPADVLEQDEAYLAPTGAARPTLEEVERRYIELTLLHAKGSQTRAAAILGISRKSLWEKRKRYGLD